MWRSASSPTVEVAKLLDFLSKMQNGADALLSGVPAAEEGTGVSLLD